MSNAKLISTILVCAALVSGCASMYSPKGMFNGYSDVQLGKDMFQISFQGDGYDSRERVSDFALLRSAEVALENGFSYFIVGITADNSSSANFTTPQTTQHNATVTGKTISGSSTSYGGQSMFFEYPNTTHTIQCFKEKPTGNGMIYEAQFVADSFRKKYGLN